MRTIEQSSQWSWRPGRFEPRSDSASAGRTRDRRL